jgi:hypothetical protein
VAAGTDLLIAESYYRDKPVPYHLRLADIEAHRAELASRRIILTHMSADMLAATGQHGYETASDGLILRLLPSPRRRRPPVRRAGRSPFPRRRRRRDRRLPPARGGRPRRA